MKRPISPTQFLFGLFLSFFFVSVFPNVATAQDIGGISGGVGGNFDLRFIPEFPGPSTEVTAQVVSNAFNVDGAPIAWILDGKTRLQGTGKKNFTFMTGEPGSSVLIRVEVNTEDFGLVSKEREIRPSDVDILWEANTYTSPFYKGKALPTSQSYIKVLAVPSFVDKKGKIPSDNLVYSWKKTYTPNPNDSGVGKNTYLYRGTYTFNENVIDTIVSTANGALSISKKTKISIYEPKIIFYERKPLEGARYENSLGVNSNIKEKEITLRAEPYFFSLENANNNGADFSWQTDGKKQETDPDKKSEFTLRKPETGSGHSNVSLKISNNGYDLQTASKNITLQYTN